MRRLQCNDIIVSSTAWMASRATADALPSEMAPHNFHPVHCFASRWQNKRAILPDLSFLYMTLKQYQVNAVAMLGLNHSLVCDLCRKVPRSFTMPPSSPTVSMS
eukprot:GHUV01049583.1.p1 GENE.GHUV01049583.1~~GHUV01049583.1.p1  ORF type:complete len:104 (-),score=10.99 GHUV01049583.1:78-389(-)